MEIPPIWMLFLGLSAAGVVAIAAGIATRGRGGAVEALVGGTIPLLTGLLIGFATLVVPPIPITWIWSIAVGGLLVIHYSQRGRLAHVGLLATGFGLTWSGIIGWRVWSDLTDPSVTGSEDAIVFLGIGLAILSAGIVIVAAAAALRPSGSAS